VNKFSVIKSFLEYVGEREGEISRVELWEKFLACPNCVVSGGIKSSFTEHSFMYCFNIVCKKKGVNIIRDDAGYCSKTNYCYIFKPESVSKDQQYNYT
jgi:hypothetical protein